MDNVSSAPDLSMMTVQEYLTERKMSNTSVILTEGKDDSIFFQLLKGYFQRKLSVDLSSFEIETAELIKSDDNCQFGNRGKVEYVCELADQSDLPVNSLRGFVDREFRGFDFSEGYSDNLSGHHQEVGRCVWSKGHSIENYFFDLDVLSGVFFEMGVSSKYDIDNLISSYNNSFSALIKSALLVSVAAKESGSLNKAVSCITESVFNVEGGQIYFDMSRFSSCLEQRVDDGSFYKFNEIIEGDKCFLQRDFAELAWALHGHIGLRLIYFSFLAFMNGFLPLKGLGRYQAISMSEFFKRLSLSFFGHVEINLDVYPGKCFRCKS